MKLPHVVIVENGAGTIKAGVLGDHGGQPRIIPNAIISSKGNKTAYFGHEFEKCQDYSSLHFHLPFEKGFLVDWDAQKAVWDGMFSSDCLEVDTTESSLLITEPYFNLPNIQEVYDQFVFEEYEFKSYYRCTPASLIPHGTLFAGPSLEPPECMIIVDSGFSFTHVVPIMNGSVLWNAVKRIDVGGKLLTNQLKELASFRQWNMMDETYIMNDIKESCCYVSTNFIRDLEITHANSRNNEIVQEYILPDFSVHRPGRIRRAGEQLDDNSQVMYMNNERFTVPEVIFRPDNIGLNQCGLATAVASSINLLPEDLRGMFWAHIGLIGGNTNIPGFQERLTNELRSLAPVECEVAVHTTNDPMTEAYRSAVGFASKPEFFQCVVTREEYLEMGSKASRRKFRDWRPMDRETDRGRDSAFKGRGIRTREDDGASSPPAAKRGTKARGRGRGAGVRRQG
ncbi:actin-like protein Arp6 [Sparassis latifolia]